MEEVKPAQDPPTQTPNPNPNPTPNPDPDPDPEPDPPNKATGLPPQPSPQPQQPPPPPPFFSAESKKRPRESRVQIQDCSYFKLRAVIRDIRPHLLEVLRTVDFRSCKGAHELQEKLKLLMELYKQMTSETVAITKLKSAPGPPLQGENGAAPKAQNHLQEPVAKPCENRPFQVGIVSEKQQAEHGENQGTHIVGGSAFGWNFITFPGGKPIYYGRTKESFRTAQGTL